MVLELGVLVQHGQYFRRRNPAVAPNRGDVRSDYGIPTRGLSILGDSEGGLRQAGPPRREPGASKKLAKAHISLGQISQAILEYEGILQEHPNDSEVLKALKELEAKTSQLAANRQPSGAPSLREDSKPTPLAPALAAGAAAPPSSPPPTTNTRRRQQSADRRVDRGETAHATSRRAAGETSRIGSRQLRREPDALRARRSCWSKSNW